MEFGHAAGERLVWWPEDVLPYKDALAAFAEKFRLLKNISAKLVSV